MRLNQFIAQATGLSRRKADEAIKQGRVYLGSAPAHLGQLVRAGDIVSFDGKMLHPEQQVTLVLHKPVGYVCSRDGQGSQTIYDLLPAEFHHLKPVGRLDKDSSGLLLMTNDGKLAHQLTHPSFQKEKVYEVTLDKSLTAADKAKIEKGVELEDGLSKLRVKGNDKQWIISMHEGRNRQIRRTLAALGYKVKRLHRTQFGSYVLGPLTSGKFEKIKL